MSTPANKKDNTDKVIRINKDAILNSPFVIKKVERAREILAKYPPPKTEKKKGDK